MTRFESAAEVIQYLQREIEEFVFFHLGADADLRVATESDSVRICLSHERITPISFQLEIRELQDLVTSPEALEDFLLEQLSRHRRRV